MYFAGQLFRKESGFGDVVPTATIGAALGPIVALESFAIACALFAVGALLAGKRFGVALQFGPAIAAAILLGSVGEIIFARA